MSFRNSIIDLIQYNEGPVKKLVDSILLHAGNSPVKSAGKPLLRNPNPAPEHVQSASNARVVGHKLQSLQHPVRNGDGQPHKPAIGHRPERVPRTEHNTECPNPMQFIFCLCDQKWELFELCYEDTLGGYAVGAAHGHCCGGFNFTAKMNGKGGINLLSFVEVGWSSDSDGMILDELVL